MLNKRMKLFARGMGAIGQLGNC